MSVTTTKANGMYLSVTGGSISGPLAGPAGSVSATTFNFGAAGTGLYSPGTHRVGIANNGALYADFDAAAVAFGRPDNTADYLAYRANAGGTITFAGSATNGTRMTLYGSGNADAGKLGLTVTSQTTVGAAGGATALPATPTGYIVAKINGTDRAIPYYAQA